jgi:3-methyladenine DNA glycosylase AlkD
MMTDFQKTKAHTITSRLQQELRLSVTSETQTSTKKFFKDNEKVSLIGLKFSVVNQIGKKYLNEIKQAKLSKEEVYTLCDELWQSGYLEEIAVACIWSHGQAKNYQPEDFEVFVGWVENYVTNWGACDTLCNHTVGDLIAMYPCLADRLLDWAKSPNRWVRRASAVSLIIPAKNGHFFEHVTSIADILLTDADDMVQKGYGWLLKSASAAREQEVFDYVMKNKSVMPRTALRYAIEKMSPERRKSAMMK